MDESDYLDDDLIIYNIISDDRRSDCEKISFQLYPSGYDAASIIVDNGAGIQSYILSHDTTSKKTFLEEIAIEDHDTIFITLTKRGYIIAGGIWQVEPGEPRLFLNCITANLLGVLALERLLLPQEIDFVQQAIDQTTRQMKEQFPSCEIWLCREVKVADATQAYEYNELNEDIAKQEHQWNMIFNYCPRGGDMLRVLVKYSPTNSSPFEMTCIEM